MLMYKLLDETPLPGNLVVSLVQTVGALRSWFPWLIAGSGKVDPFLGLVVCGNWSGLAERA